MSASELENSIVDQKISAGCAFTVESLPYPSAQDFYFQKIRHLPLPVLLHSGQPKVCPDKADIQFDICTAAPIKIIRTNSNETTVMDIHGKEIKSLENPFDVLSKEFPIDQESSATELPFTGGLIGYFGYELLHTMIGIKSENRQQTSMPDMLMGLYPWALITDHTNKKCQLIFRNECPELLKEEILGLLKSMKTSKPAAFSLTSEFVSNFSKEEYNNSFQKVIDYIFAGDCYQVNLSQCFTASCQGDSLTAFNRLQEKAQAPFAAFMEDNLDSKDKAVLSFSPERFIQVRNKKVLTQPIKGTRPRDKDPQKDQQNLAELSASHKDKAENLMIVDLLRNDIGRVCETGSVSVPEIFKSYSYSNVHHLVSTITGTLENRNQVFELLKASFPGGSITGTPKIRSMEIINELETAIRSVYCGSFAYIDYSGNMDSNICIRTLVRENEKIRCWGGGAVVADSTAEQEYQETIDKISLFMQNLG